MSEVILDMSREDVEKLKLGNSHDSLVPRVNLFNLKSFAEISRQIGAEKIASLAELRFVSFKGQINLTSGIINVNSNGISLEDVEFINSITPEDIAKLKNFNFLSSDEIGKIELRTLLPFVRNFQKKQLRIWWYYQIFYHFFQSMQDI